MLSMQKRLFLPVAVAATILLDSCAPSAHEPTETYVLVATHTSIPYWQTAQAGLRRAGSELKVKVDMVGPAGYDPKAQKDELASVIQEKPAGILISAADASLLSADIDSAVQQGIPVITIDSDVPTSKRLFFIGSDNYAAGKLGGQLLVKLLGGKGNVVMFTYPKQNNLIERQKGYQSVFDDYPNIKLTQAVDIQGDPTIASSTARELLTSKAQVDAFVCLEAVAGPEVGKVVTETNKTGKVTIMAMDTDEGTLKWIRQGVIAATIAQRPFTMAYLGVKMLDDIHHHMPKSLGTNFAQDTFSPYPALVGTGTFIVDKDNVGKLAEQSPTQPKAQ
jgi:ribose transport system substrate-binding protein